MHPYAPDKKFTRRLLEACVIGVVTALMLAAIIVLIEYVT
jgi:hypothetical protein